MTHATNGTILDVLDLYQNQSQESGHAFFVLSIIINFSVLTTFIVYFLL